MFISFEGIDGAGKSSHIPWMAGLLRNRGKVVVVTRELGGTPIGEKIRGLVLSESMNIETEVLLAFASRKQHVADVIEPALNRGEIVLTDRFTDSTYAFQGAGRGVPAKKIRELDDWYGGFSPDLTFLFDLPVEVAMGRISTERVLDRFELEKVEFHQRVRNRYLTLADHDPKRIRIIDANRPIEVIREDLQEYVLAALACKQAPRETATA